MVKEKKYFLKNANMLEEMLKSKLTFSCYDKEHYDGHYDLITCDYNMITPNMIFHFFEKNPNMDRVYIRVMTYEHIPESYQGKNGKYNLQELKMTPFKHYMIMRNDFEECYSQYAFNTEKIEKLEIEIERIKTRVKDNYRNIRLNQLTKQKQVPYKEDNDICKENINSLSEQIRELTHRFSNEIMSKAQEVLRSHWKGKSIEEGDFCISHGKLTDGLVMQIMMLIDRYAHAGNYAGYTYLDDMKGAAILQLYDVALKFEESKSTNVFAYFTTVVSNKFKAILKAEKDERDMKSVFMQMAGYDATFREQIEEEERNKEYDMEQKQQDEENQNQSDEENYE